jgi:hypothetical protein
VDRHYRLQRVHLTIFPMPFQMLHYHSLYRITRICWKRGVIIIKPIKTITGLHLASQRTDFIWRELSNLFHTLRRNIYNPLHMSADLEKSHIMRSVDIDGRSRNFASLPGRDMRLDSSPKRMVQLWIPPNLLMNGQTKNRPLESSGGGMKMASRCLIVPRLTDSGSTW